jgi:hypothetical protein
MENDMRLLLEEQLKDSPQNIHKDVANKPRCDLLIEYFPHALLELSKICNFGAEKYGEHTWEDVPVEAYKAAMLRHMFNAEIEECDKESGLTHETHMCWNALAQLELWLKNGGLKCNNT